MTAADAQAQINRALIESGSDSAMGLCVGHDWAANRALVNVGGNVVPMPWAGSAPWIGDRVRVVWTARNPVCTAVHGAAIGSVQSVSSGVATVLGDDGKTYEYPIVIGSGVGTGHRVRIDHAGRIIPGRYAAEPPGSAEFDVPPPLPAAGGKATFVPTESGSWRDGQFRSGRVEVNAFRKGVIYFGTQIRDTLPAGAVITRAELHLTEEYDYYPSSSCPLGTHAAASSGAGDPSLSGAIPITDGGVIDIRSIAGNFLSGHLGVGFGAGSGQRAFSAAPGSGRIHMEWNV